MKKQENLSVPLARMRSVCSYYIIDKNERISKFVSLVRSRKPDADIDYILLLAGTPDLERQRAIGQTREYLAASNTPEHLHQAAIDSASATIDDDYIAGLAALSDAFDCLEKKDLTVGRDGSIRLSKACEARIHDRAVFDYTDDEMALLDTVATFIMTARRLNEDMSIVPVVQHFVTQGRDLSELPTDLPNIYLRGKEQTERKASPFEGDVCRFLSRNQHISWH